MSALSRTGGDWYSGEPGGRIAVAFLISGALASGDLGWGLFASCRRLDRAAEPGPLQRMVQAFRPGATVPAWKRQALRMAQLDPRADATVQRLGLRVGKDGCGLGRPGCPPPPVEVEKTAGVVGDVVHELAVLYFGLPRINKAGPGECF